MLIYFKFDFESWLLCKSFGNSFVLRSQQSLNICSFDICQLGHLSRRHRQAQGEETFSSLRCLEKHLSLFVGSFPFFVELFGGVQDDILRITLIEKSGGKKWWNFSWSIGVPTNLQRTPNVSFSLWDLKNPKAPYRYFFVNPDISSYWTEASPTMPPKTPTSF